MNELFAFEPNSLAADDAEYCAALAKKFGFGTGLFMVNAPENWAEMLGRLAASSSTMKSKRLREFAIKLRKEALLLESERVIHDLDWSAATALSDRGNVVNLIADKPGGSQSAIREIVVGPHLEKLEPSRSERAFGTSGNFLRILTPLISFGGEIHLVDRYAATNILSRDMDQKTFFQEVFAGIGKISSMSKSPVTEFVIHLFDSPEAPNKAFLDERLRAMLSSKQLKGVRLPKIKVFESPISHEDLHKRYVLGRHGGLELDSGLRADPARKCQFNYVENKIHKELWHEYVSGDSGYGALQRRNRGC